LHVGSSGSFGTDLLYVREQARPRPFKRLIAAHGVQMPGLHRDYRQRGHGVFEGE